MSRLLRYISTHVPFPGQQTVRAALELGIVVGVCLMVGLGFMTMVGLELFIDKLIDEYRCHASYLT